MSTTVDKRPFEEAIANMSINLGPYFRDYVFYMHLIAQCRINYDETMPAAAGVSFHGDHYVLHLNPLEVIMISPITGEEILGFCARMPLAQRIGILKHEMLHIAYNHLERFVSHTGSSIKPGEITEEIMKKHKMFNYASDCALNQDIIRDHLPKYAIYPDNYPVPEAAKHLKQTAEFYYDLLLQHAKKQASKGKGKGKGNGKGEEGEGFELGEGSGVDDHDTWLRSEGDSVIQKEVTKRMVERAANETMKSRGNLPSDYAEMIENLTIRREVDWKQVLRRICGNKKANRRKVITRKDRRLPHMPWIKGTVKNRVFELAVVSDVSGSVSNVELEGLWGEIISICNTFNTGVNVVQVDTEPKDPTPLTKSCKAYERKASGGTYLSPAIPKFKEHGIHFDAMVVTTDGELCPSDIEPFRELGVPIIWLISTRGRIMTEMNSGLMTAIKLTNEKDS